MRKISLSIFINFFLLLFMNGNIAMAEQQNDSIPLTAQEVHPLGRWGFGA